MYFFRPQSEVLATDVQSYDPSVQRGDLPVDCYTGAEVHGQPPGMEPQTLHCALQPRIGATFCLYV